MCVLFSLLSSDREFMKQPVESNQDPTTLGSCWGRFIMPFCCFCSSKFGVPGTSSTGNASWPSWRSMSHPKSWKPTTDSPRVAPTGTLGRQKKGFRVLASSPEVESQVLHWGPPTCARLIVSSQVSWQLRRGRRGAVPKICCCLSEKLGPWRGRTAGVLCSLLQID